MQPPVLEAHWQAARLPTSCRIAQAMRYRVKVGGRVRAISRVIFPGGLVAAKELALAEIAPVIGPITVCRATVAIDQAISDDLERQAIGPVTLVDRELLEIDRAILVDPALREIDQAISADLAE
jgi:hypothetical protein